MKRLRGIASGLLLCTGLLAPAIAAADEAPAEDTIHLRNGGLYRGRVTEIVPGDHVTVIVIGGETKRIAWAEVDRVIVPSTTMPPPPAAAAPPAIVGPTARVHLKGASHATLFRHPAGTSDLLTACEAPCDMDMPLGDTYKIGGSGITTTSEFHLQAAPGGSVEIGVDGPSWVGIGGGGLMVVGGAATAYIGALIALAGFGCEGCYDQTSIRNTGLVVTGVGAALIGVGLAIVLPSMKTDLSQESSSPAAPVVRDAFVRSPSWATAGTKHEASITPAASFPALFERHF
jgi:hypothetical protein